MDFVEFQKGDLVDNSIEIAGYQEGNLGRIYFGYCRNRLIRVAIKTFVKKLWVNYNLADKWHQIKDELIGARLPSRSIDIGEYFLFTFFREARLVCQSRNHPNVIKGSRLWWTDAGQPFYECEFVENSQDLDELYRNNVRMQDLGRLSILEIAHIGVSFCNGMIYINDEMIRKYNEHHQSNQATLFVHRDIKPKNILIDSRNMIKIIDMGLAKFHLQQTTSHFVDFPIRAGTEEYMSPEQNVNFESVFPSSDIYSFGLTMLELLGGDIFNAHAFAQSQGGIAGIKGLPNKFRQIVSKCLRSKMNNRYQNFIELKRAIIRFISDVKNGRIKTMENIRCIQCGYINPEFKVSQCPNDHQMVRVPAGPFCKGCSSEHKKRLQSMLRSGSTIGDERYEKVHLDEFEIDIFAVTNEQYRKFIEDTGYNDIPSHWKKAGDPDAPFPEREATFPIVNVSFDDVQSYCKWAEMRLPTGDEWEKAARGTDGRFYPWGDNYDSSLCNSAESGKGMPVTVEDFDKGTSPYGCCQMVGNIFEWVNESHPKSDDYKFLRGGSWAVSCELLGPPFMHYISAPKNSTGASRQRDIFGFRCARDAGGSIKEDPPEVCPLCGGEFVEFKLKDIKVPENNVYTWVGYFDIE